MGLFFLFKFYDYECAITALFFLLKRKRGIYCAITGNFCEVLKIMVQILGSNYTLLLFYKSNKKVQKKSALIAFLLFKLCQ